MGGCNISTQVDKRENYGKKERKKINEMKQKKASKFSIKIEEFFVVVFRMFVVDCGK